MAVACDVVAAPSSPLPQSLEQCARVAHNSQVACHRAQLKRNLCYCIKILIRATISDTEHQRDYCRHNVEQYHIWYVYLGEQEEEEVGEYQGCEDEVFVVFRDQREYV